MAPANMETQSTGISGDFNSILKERDTFGTGRGENAADQINTWFDDLVLQSGLGISPSLMVSLCIVATLTVGGIVFVIQENLLTTALGCMIGIIIPILVTIVARTRRLDKMSSQIPPMLEELARAAKTGRSIDQSLRMVADDTPNPLGAELRQATGRMDMGVPMRDALRDLPRRTGLMSLGLMCTSLIVQQQTGGDLVSVLERLSRTVRDRLLFLGRLRAATAASRATAVLMLVLPPSVLAFFIYRKPTYMEELLSSSWGRGTMFSALILELIGALWVMRILSDSEKS